MTGFVEFDKVWLLWTERRFNVILVHELRHTGAIRKTTLAAGVPARLPSP